MKTPFAQRTREHWESSPIETDDLPCGWTDVLIQLIENGPVDDGDVASKPARDALIECGFAAKVIIGQQEAGTCATYYGRELYCQLIDEWGLHEAIAKRQATSALKRY
ncbi:hypothetical protein HDG34_003281 [Paraburkholderia sp. HC6.4b]|uniref:hypothetical protein n=1 Tax=unclassified Paraburkholderia TaxID=2615204 RepID=UPI001612289B|nr:MULTISPECIES: hypothetical protein [unclassified Paraburkholderia]MBB5409340.1 hypothetical protein [Paraburkholderia sp. HC6.4b]MBB5451068.1 hypothetical protein [Paraburkholderia sp. Kb1A]